ncbi:MAG: HEAT repeat domain-containing protein [Candidatus Dormibacteria bacterium]
MSLFGPPDVATLTAKGDVPGLIKVLGHGSDAWYFAREGAARALGEIGDARAVDPLLKADVVGCEVRDALSRIGAAAVERLIAALHDRHEGVRERAAEALGKIGDIRAVEALIAALDDRDERVCWLAAQALGRIGDVRAVEALIAALDRHENVCSSAAEALGRIGEARAVEPLIAALANFYESVRRAAAEALGRIGDVRAIEALIAALHDRHESVRRAATEALARLGWRPDRTGTGVGYWIAQDKWEECVKMGAPAIEPLAAVLRDVNWQRRRAAAEALGRIGDTRAVEALVDTLAGDTFWGVRKAAAEALGLLGWQPDSTEAGAAYWAAEGDWDKCVDIGVDAVRPLGLAFQDTAASLGDMPAIAAALGRIGDSRAIEPLVWAFKNDAAVRRGEEFKRSLGVRARIRDPQPLILGQEITQAAAKALDKLGWQPDDSVVITCGSCGARVTRNASVCPSCHANLSGIRCTKCKHVGPESEFVFGRCPKCGAGVSGILGP